MVFERVYTVTDYYDGQREGVADFRGLPHRYRSIGFLRTDPDPDDDRFELTPISQEVLALALEDWAIWLRWEAAFQAGKVDARTHPALPEDRVRHETVKDALSRALASSAAPRVVARAEFRVAAPAPDLPPGVFRPLEVHWQPVAGHAESV